MKKVFLFISILTIALQLQAMQSPTQNTIKELAVGVNGIYFPAGITEQSNAYVVVNGLFPNGCYSLSQPKISHKDDFNHEIYTMAKVKQGICLRVMVPFTKEIMLGQLKSGQHTFNFVADDGTSLEKVITVQ